MLEELFNNVVVYGRYVKINKLNSNEYWNEIENFLKRPEQVVGLDTINKILSSKWDFNFSIDSKNFKNVNKLENIHYHSHTELRIYGNNPREIPENNKSLNNNMSLTELLKIAYNLGQSSIRMGIDELKNSHKANNLDKIKSYVNLDKEQEEKIRDDKQIQDLITNLGNHLLAIMNRIQTGGNGDYEPFYSENVEQLTKDNEDYRRVVYTGPNQQFVLMSIKPLDDIKMETHKDHDQFIRIEQGEGKAIIGQKEYDLKDNTGLIVPAGTQHKIMNTSSTESLKLYTIYSPKEHTDKLVQPTNPDKLDDKMKSDDKMKLDDKMKSDENLVLEDLIKIGKKNSEQVGGNYSNKNYLKYLKYKTKYYSLKNK